ncbi:MAG TPA: hypothetical protein VGF94_06335 [Kofleriaceae bacterium]
MAACAEGAARVRRLALALVWFVAGCGSTPAPAPAQPAKPPPAIPPGAAPGSCPESYDAARGPCIAPASGCSYPQGDCACVVDEPHFCSGMVRPKRPPPPKPPPTVWLCTPKPPAIRADGCPGTDPNGRACHDEGKQCTYGNCCVASETCEDGVWKVKRTECPP